MNHRGKAILLAASCTAAAAAQANGPDVNQLIAVAISWVLAIVGTLIILNICDAVLGVRVDAGQETDGLDLTLHGEEDYNFEG